MAITWKNFKIFREYFKWYSELHKHLSCELESKFIPLNCMPTSWILNLSKETGGSRNPAIISEWSFTIPVRVVSQSGFSQN